MNVEDITLQIGQAVCEYQAAKLEVARVESKVSSLFHLYRRIGASLKDAPDSRGEPKIINGKLAFPDPARECSASGLLDEAGLLALIHERDEARSRLWSARIKLQSLGITELS